MMLRRAALIGVLSGLILAGSVPPVTLRAQSPGPVQVLEFPELMEMFFKPGYAELTRAVTNKPAGRQAWRAIYDPARRLAELHNLFFFRREKPYMAEPGWAAAADASRKALLDISEAVRKQDYPGTRQRYEASVKACNACHEKYSPDAPTLKPYVPEVK